MCYISSRFVYFCGLPKRSDRMSRNCRGRDLQPRAIRSVSLAVVEHVQHNTRTYLPVIITLFILLLLLLLLLCLAFGYGARNRTRGWNNSDERIFLRLSTLHHPLAEEFFEET